MDRIASYCTKTFNAACQDHAAQTLLRGHEHKETSPPASLEPYQVLTARKLGEFKQEIDVHRREWVHLISYSSRAQF